MSDICTLLLVPAPIDTTLLAEEVGGTVPAAHGFTCGDESHGLWWRIESDDRDAPVCDVCSARQRWDADRALILALNGNPVHMGIDRAYRVARHVHDVRRRAFLAIKEIRAKAIYATYPGVDKHPWVEGGCSERQNDARYAAFCALVAEGVDPVEGVSSIMGATYEIEDAIRIAKWAADLLGCQVVALDADRKEVTL